MPSASPSLYSELSSTSSLVIFKGDLNYRKLLGDRAWPHETPFDVSLAGFRPAPLLTLRTMVGNFIRFYVNNRSHGCHCFLQKADLVSGLPPGRSESLMASEPDWMITGKWALIQFAPRTGEKT